MHFSTLVILALSLSSAVIAGPAPVSKENPKNIVAVADFPESGPNKFTKGYVYFTSPKGDTVKVHVDMTGLPNSGGPFVYHIHEKQIFSKTDCEEAGKHFDPFSGFVKCPESGDDALCMVGDLSGKHGWINATCFQTEYFDKFLSLNPASESYIIGRSLVFHDQGSARFACANINLASAEQHEYLFGNSGKNSGSGSSGPESAPQHANTDHSIPKNEPIPKPPGPAPVPAPAPTPSLEEPKPAVEPKQPAALPSSGVSSPIKSEHSIQIQTTGANSTAGFVATPTGESENTEGSENNFANKATATQAPSNVVSGAAPRNFFTGIVGTVFSLFLGVVF